MLGLGVILASAPAAASQLLQPDYRPFVIEKEVWTAQLTSFGPGTERFRIEYRSSSDWVGTQLEHSFTPSRAGSTWTYRDGELTFYDASRRHTSVSRGPIVIDNWIQPGLLHDLRGSGKARVSA